jgi:citrate lyase beta subunit
MFHCKSLLTALVVGSNDLVKEMRCRVDAERRPLQVAHPLELLARSAGLA